MLKRCALMAALALVVSPQAARADWLFTPNIGTTFGADASGHEHLTYGASIGWMGKGIVGWEGDLQYSPEFFEPTDTDVDFSGKNNVLSAMGNIIVGIPIGGQKGSGIRPFGIAGVGLLKQRVQSGDAAVDITNNDFGFNVGGGVMGFFNDHIGLRGDIRYVRSFENLTDNVTTLGVGNFDFWRTNVGLVVRW